MHINKKTIRYVFLGIIACILVYWLLHEFDQVKKVWDYLTGIFSPFVIGGVMAFILNVPMRAFDKLFRRIKSDVLRRVLSILATLFTLIAVIVGVIMLVIPQLVDTIHTLTKQLPSFFGNLESNLQAYLQAHPDLMEWVVENGILTDFNWNGLIEQLAGVVGNSFSVIVSGAISAVGGLATFLFNLVISICFAFYCLARKETLARQGRKLLYAICKESHADFIIRVLRMTNSTFSNFLTGQCLDALILGLLFVPVMMIFRMPYIPLICVLISVTALVPLVGAFAGCILGAFFIMVDSPMLALIFVIIFLLIQQFEGNVIYPRVVGSSVGLPGMWVLLAVTVGGGFWGVTGMFLMVPIGSVIYTLIREFTHKRLEKRQIDPEKLQEHPPELQPHFMLRRRKKRKAEQEKNTSEE